MLRPVLRPAAKYAAGRSTGRSTQIAARWPHGFLCVRTRNSIMIYLKIINLNDALIYSYYNCMTIGNAFLPFCHRPRAADAAADVAANYERLNAFLV